MQRQNTIVIYLENISMCTGIKFCFVIQMELFHLDYEQSQMSKVR